MPMQGFSVVDVTEVRCCAPVLPEPWSADGAGDLTSYCARYSTADAGGGRRRSPDIGMWAGSVPRRRDERSGGIVFDTSLSEIDSEDGLVELAESISRRRP
jgi:hypothetical protein